MDDLRYPIGKYEFPKSITSEMRAQWIEDIAAAPERVRVAVAGLSAEQLDTPYRPGGWTVRQLIHHLPDSHMNAYVRFRLALTEDEPLVKVYDEQKWAELPDARTGPPEVSLTLLEAMHARWTALLQAMSPADFRRTYRHPELGARTLEDITGMYAWHCRHHTAHITSLRQRMRW